ncbi:hypothetical protein EON76_00055 [bacterium]|nr:MAG: hypothetical protein EON76_00055 [bacterium]
MTESERLRLIRDCEALIVAYNEGVLGDIILPEDTRPVDMTPEQQLVYYTLPMSLNYRRSSTQLWKAAHESFADDNLSNVYELERVTCMSEDRLRELLTQRSLAVQPTRHTQNWRTIAMTIHGKWGGIGQLLAAADHDYLELSRLVQKAHKKGFPYLSGPKLFNYWCFILVERCGIELKNDSQIDIAVDVHIRKASARLGLLTPEEAEKLGAPQIAQMWREVLHGSSIAPMSLNVPLWAWSRGKFLHDPSVVESTLS